MHSILDFTRRHTAANVPPPSHPNLRLMLWAGDGEFEGLSDIERLPNYDVYLCLGFEGPRFDKNVENLTGSQKICILNIHDKEQMARFQRVFAGSFALINADYRGNTPALPLDVYETLLAPNGRAYNTEGINGLRMREEDLLNTLEIFAPILSPELKQRRQWSALILEVARGADITPGEAVSSPDLKNPIYSEILENHRRFVQWQSERNQAWPLCAQSLEEQWTALADRVLTWGILKDSFVIEVIRPHLPKFSDYLEQRIGAFMLEKGMDRHDYQTECEKTDGEPVSQVRFKQRVLKWLLREVPAGLSAQIGYYADERLPGAPTEFGLSYLKSPVA
jgi:hypothetical protein